jgi:predicted neuraminidase
MVIVSLAILPVFRGFWEIVRESKYLILHNNIRIRVIGMEHGAWGMRKYSYQQAAGNWTQGEYKTVSKLLNNLMI